MGDSCEAPTEYQRSRRSYGPVPEELVLSIMFAAWAGFTCFFIADLISRVAGSPLPYTMMVPFLVLGFLIYALFGSAILMAELLENDVVSRGDAILASASAAVAVLFLVDIFVFWIRWESRRQLEIRRRRTSQERDGNALILDTV